MSFIVELTKTDCKKILKNIEYKGIKIGSILKGERGYYVVLGMFPYTFELSCVYFQNIPTDNVMIDNIVSNLFRVTVTIENLVKNEYIVYGEVSSKVLYTIWNNKNCLQTQFKNVINRAKVILRIREGSVIRTNGSLYVKLNDSDKYIVIKDKENLVEKEIFDYIKTFANILPLMYANIDFERDRDGIEYVGTLERKKFLVLKNKLRLIGVL